MNVAQFDSMLKQIKEESGLATVRAIFDGSGNVQIFLSDSWPEDPWGHSATRDVPIEVLSSHYYFDWLTETGKYLKTQED